MAGALKQLFPPAKKSSKQKLKNSQQGRKQLLVALTTEHLTFRGNFYLPVQSLLGPSS